MSAKKNNEHGDELVFVCGENLRDTLIDEGVYETQVIKKEKSSYRGEMKLYLHHKIISPGIFQGIVLFEPINAKYKSYGPGSKFYKNWTVANYGRRLKKGQTMPLHVFDNKVFKVAVRTVASEDGTKYSVVDNILSVVFPDDPLSLSTQTHTQTITDTGTMTDTNTRTNTKHPCIRGGREK